MSIAGLPPGTYELRAELPSFKPHVRRSLQLTIAQALVLNLTLEVGGLSEEVTVTGDTSLVNTSSAELSYLVGIGSNRAAAAERPELHRPRAAAAGRARVSTSRRRFGRRARPRDERQRAGSALERLPARRHAAERLHQRPGGQRGRHGARHRDHSRVPRRIERLQRRVRTQLRRPDQRADEVGGQHDRRQPSTPTTATTRSTRATTSMPASSPTSTATSSAPRSAARSPGIGAFFFLGYEALIERLGRTVSTVVPDDNARTGHPAERPGGGQSRGGAVPRRVSRAPTARRSARGSRRSRSRSNQRLDEHFAQGRLDYNLGSGNQFFARYTLDDTDQFLPTDYPQFPRNFISRNQFFTGGVPAHPLAEHAEHRAHRLQPDPHRPERRRRTPRSRCAPFVADARQHGRHRHRRPAALRPAELRQPAARAERVQRRRTTWCTRAGGTC